MDLQALVVPYFEKRLLLGVTLGIVDANLSPGREATSIEAAGLVNDSTGEDIYYTDATSNSAVRTAYVEVLDRPAEAAGMYAELARPYVKDVKRSR